jgi:hypothetical protein
MQLSPRVFKLSDKPGSLGLSCSERGLDLAGVPLLVRVQDSFSPRSDTEIRALIGHAYRGEIDPNGLMGGLAVIAGALNHGELTRAMIAAVLLKLPELDWDGAVRIAQAENALAKFGFDPNERRDWRGRWTADGDMRSSPANDHFRAPGRVDGLVQHTLRPILPFPDQGEDADLLDIEWHGEFHEDIKHSMVEYLKSQGLTVATEVNFYLNGSSLVTRADIVAMAPGDPSTLSVIEIKTGPFARLRTSQSWVYPGLVHGGIVSSPDPKIASFGYSIGQPLPPVPVIIWYERDPATRREMTLVKPTFPFVWRPGQ